MTTGVQNHPTCARQSVWTQLRQGPVTASCSGTACSAPPAAPWLVLLKITLFLKIFGCESHVLCLVNTLNNFFFTFCPEHSPLTIKTKKRNLLFRVNNKLCEIQCQNGVTLLEMTPERSALFLDKLQEWPRNLWVSFKIFLLFTKVAKGSQQCRFAHRTPRTHTCSGLAEWVTNST